MTKKKESFVCYLMHVSKVKKKELREAFLQVQEASSTDKFKFFNQMTICIHFNNVR